MPSMTTFVCHQSPLHFHKGSRTLSQNSCPSRSLSFPNQFICALNPRFISQRSAAYRIPSMATGSNPKRFQVFSVAPQAETVELEERDSSDGFWSSLPQTFISSVAEAVSSIHKPAMIALFFFLLVTQKSELAFAASGGRVGGSSFPKASQTRTAPARPAPSQSYSSSSRPIISSPSPFQAYETEYITSTLTAPTPTYYGAPAAGVGFGSGGAFFLVFLGCAAVQVVIGFISERSMRGSLLTGSQTSSVMKLQVGLLGMARTLQRDLDKIADDADTTTPEGLHYILTEACLAMMRHPDFCTSGLSSSYIKHAVNETEEQFNQLSLEERGKFDEETLVNVNSLRKRMMAVSKGSRFSNEFIVGNIFGFTSTDDYIYLRLSNLHTKNYYVRVKLPNSMYDQVTILVAVEGEQKLPIINCSEDLTDALQRLGSLPADSIQAVEVLWTPQDENDTLSERDLLRKYPLLRSL